MSSTATVPRERISNVGQLRPGDHISRPTGVGIGQHHMIVSCVIDVSRNTVMVIHVTTNGGSSESSASSALIGYGLGQVEHEAHVVQQVVDFSENVLAKNLFRYVYTNRECLDVKQVLQNASALIGQKVDFDLLTNNCEHFARACKTGVAESDQVRNLMMKVSKIVESSTSSSAISWSPERHKYRYRIRKLLLGST